MPDRLIANAASLVTTLDSLSDGFWLLDPDWKFVYVNEEACRSTGETAANLLGRTLWEAFPALVGTNVEANCRRALAERITVEFDSFYRPLERWFGLKAFPTPQGGLVILSRDISAVKSAEEALRAAHDTFRHLVEHSPFGVYAVDADFRIVQVSAGAARVFANVPPPLLGRDFAAVLRMLWPEPFATEAIGRFRHTLETGEPYHSPSTLERRADIGAVESYDWKIERLTLPDGRFGVVCHFYDLTDRQRLEAALRASERRFQLASDAAGAMVYDVDPAGKRPIVVYGLERLVGYRPEEATLTTDWWLSLIHPEDQATHRANLLQHLQRGGSYKAVYRVRRKDGEWIWVEAAAQVVSNDQGEVVQIVGTLIDITQRKRAEDALRDAERRKDEFLATLGHELRNPLAPLRNCMELLQRGSNDPERTQTMLATMERQVAQMTRLVDDLLDVSRIATNKVALQTQRAALSSIMRDVIEACAPAIEHAGHELRVEEPAEPIYLHADPARLTQVFCNLIANSCKYTERGGSIQLKIERDGSEAVVSVSDTGAGIPPDLLPRVFDLFMQDARVIDRATGGMGLGLPLVKRLVELHGGKVFAHSDGPGLGSTFVVRLPVVDVDECASARAHLESATDGVG